EAQQQEQRGAEAIDYGQQQARQTTGVPAKKQTVRTKTLAPQNAVHGGLVPQQQRQRKAGEQHSHEDLPQRASQQGIRQQAKQGYPQTAAEQKCKGGGSR